MRFPSVQVSAGVGAAIHSHLPANATIAMKAPTDNSVRWILGEDAEGGIRDMWNPTCFGDPGR